METQLEKVYVAIGNDLEDGLGTLDWVLKKWPPYSLYIVILYADDNMGKDHVFTPFGKLSKTLLSDEKLDGLRKSEMDKILSKYIAYCAKVKLEIINIDKYDEPPQNIIMELICGAQISKLVMGFSFLKSSTWRSRNEITGLFYIHRKKPDSCELFVIYGGKLVFLREENNEGFIEDDQGNLVAKVGKKSCSFKGWFGKMFQDNSGTGRSPPLSPSPLTSMNVPNHWETYVEEIEAYFNQLLSSNGDEQDDKVANDILCNDISEKQDKAEITSTKEKVEVMKMKLQRAEEAIELYKREAKTSIERKTKAEWVISLCIQQAEELEARVSRENAKGDQQKKDLNARNKELHEIRTEVEERRRQLASTLELQIKLSNNLTSSSLSKSHLEVVLQNAATKSADVVREIEVLRSQRDAIRRRIEFCREKNDGTSITDVTLNYKEFTPEEIRVATDGFSQLLAPKCAGVCSYMYKGRIISTTVAIEPMMHLLMTEKDFKTKVKLLCEIRHPNIMSVLGFCSELQYIVFEYMHNGCLEDTLISSHGSARKRNQGLNWHARIRIAGEVCSGLAFLHQARPRAIYHGNLDPSEILLDHNNVAKIHSSRLGYCRDEHDIKSDIRAFGRLLLQLLTGRNWDILVHEAAMVEEQVALQIDLLDETAGEWPLDLAMELGRIAARCLSGDNGDYGAGAIMGELDQVRTLAYNLLANGEVYNRSLTEESCTVPSAFICPIYQDIMKEPYLAADGFSYEQEAIREWLRTGHDTSPMTNLQLKHTHLAPNYTLHSLIQDWHTKTRVENQ